MSRISPDAGGVERARAFAKRLNAGLAIVDKRRSAPNQARAMAVIGDVKDKTVIIQDDMIDTAGTLIEAASAIAEQGAGHIAEGGLLAGQLAALAYAQARVLLFKLALIEKRRQLVIDAGLDKVVCCHCWTHTTNRRIDC